MKREHDRTTALVKELLDDQNASWLASQTDEDKLKTVEHWIFNIVIWRRFGTYAFIQEVGVLEVPDSQAELDNCIESICREALKLWRSGIAACTDGYSPAKHCNSAEESAWYYGSHTKKHVGQLEGGRQKLIEQIQIAQRIGSASQLQIGIWRKQLCTPDGEKRIARVYKELLTKGNAVMNIWENLRGIANALRIGRKDQSWQHVVQTLRGIPQFGGTGFLAKEIVQDSQRNVDG